MELENEVKEEKVKKKKPLFKKKEKKPKEEKVKEKKSLFKKKKAKKDVEQLEEYEMYEPKKKKKRKIRLKWNKKCTIVLVVLLVIFGALLSINLLLFPHIKLKGGDKITINYKVTYKENGYSAYKLKDNLTKKVIVKGKVNSEKLGDYKITYTVGKGFFKTKKVRTVSVKDLSKPKMSIDDSDAYVCPGKEYVKEEVSATDNYDGDLTKKVKADIKKEKVTYSVKDSSGNEKVVTKKIRYEDIEKPTISLNNYETYDICVNDVYKDPGYTATDNCDGDLNDKVQIDGSVDNSLEGEYSLTYSVKDNAGNEASAVRTVRVSNGDAPGVVYLTFDDGPNEGTTDVILDILKEEGVSATFFVTNAGPDYLIQREANEGHTVALHTASHEYSIVYASDEAYFNDLQIVHDRVLNLTGIDSKIVRFPGGSSNTISRHYSYGIMSRLTQELVNRGYKYYDWNISSGDAEGGSPPPSKIYNNVVSNLRKDRVNMVLMHDIKTYTRDALRDIIRYCKDNGYQIRKITNCTEMVKQRVNN